ncbi:MAG: hypothetical protein ABI873_10035 [Marmoricola sp.]
MYADTGAVMRQEFAALLRQHRVQQRLGGAGHEREEHGLQIRQYRQSVLIWCSQALQSTSPLTFSNHTSAQPNPFRNVGTGGSTASPAGELVRAIDLAKTQTTATPATSAQLTSPSSHAMVEHWREAARAAALAEHDTPADITGRMSARQAQAVVGDVAAITQALVVLDQRYRNTPGWEQLAQGSRLGWAALAAALDVNLGQPDYTVDALGWRPKTKLIEGPTRPGILGVLQAEHNLVVRMKTFPNATNLRYVLDSQRLLSRQLVPFAARIDQRLADRWTARTDTYTLLQHHFRRIGGRLGHGGHAAAEGANATSRLHSLPPDTIVDPRVLGGFQLLFDRLDQRIANVIEDGIDNCAFFQRVTLPRLVEGGGELIAPARERFVPIDRTANSELIETVRRQLLPRREVTPATPGPTRADLHSALIHRPTKGGPSDPPHL